MRTLGLLLFLIVLIFTLSFIATAVQQNNGIPDVFAILFPEQFVDKEDQKAIETKMAPFESDAAPVPDLPDNAYTAPISEQEAASRRVDLNAEIEYDPLGDAVNITEELDMQHRHEGAVNRWVNDAVSEILNFSITEYEQHRATIMAELMNDNALREFEVFMNKSQMLALMRQNNYQLRAFVQDVPTMMTSGVVEERFRWVYDVPVTMTFLPLGFVKYEENAEDQDFVTDNATFRMQLGRSASGGREGIIIETWEILPKKKEE